ncbi:MAG: hypothetical protein F4Y02_03455, partial [Chloroflexi bacterium]|nr:hypothetical protein [Chloroflexota bacterium]
ADWDTPQWVTVSVGRDSDTAGETETIEHTATSGDARYDGIEIASVNVVIEDMNQTRMPTGNLTASRTYCTILTNETTCPVTLRWTSQDTTAVQVRRIMGTTNEILVRSGSPTGSYDFDGVEVTESVFYLYDYSGGSRGRQLGLPVTVTGIKELTISPTSGDVGTVVTITGSHFGAQRGDSVVYWKTHIPSRRLYAAFVPTVEYRSWSDTEIQAVVPEGAGIGLVKVSVGDTERFVHFEVTGIVDPMVPVVSSVSPTSGPVGTWVTVYGSNFGATQGTSTVAWQTVCRDVFRATQDPPTGILVPATEYRNWSDTSLEARVPAGVPLGSYDVVVTVNEEGSGCGGTSTVNDFTVIGEGAPRCDSFTASPTDICNGGSSTLSWRTSDADGVTIDQGVGPVTPVAGGSETVSPTTTTTYTLTATNTVGTATCTATVNVWNTPTATISADRTTINEGQPFTLSWSSSNADSVRIDPGIGTVAPNASGSRELRPSEGMHTYTITASNPGCASNATSTVTVTVRPKPAGNITASPNPCTIESGDDDCTTTLTWSATGTTGLLVKVSRDGQRSRVVSSSGASGSASPSWIEQGSSYKFSLYDYMDRVEGAELDSVTVTGVTPGTPTCGITASPADICSSGTSRLTWTSSNATSAELGPDGIVVDPNDHRDVSPSSDTEYTLTVTGAGGSAMCKTTVNVWDPPTASISANRTTFNEGQPFTLSWNTTNAGSASIDQGVGSVTPNASGSRTLTPSEGTHTYTLTASKATGSPCSDASDSVTVTVRPKPTNPSITASPNPCMILPGSNTCTTTITWSATGTNGTLVEVDHRVRVFATSGATGSQDAAWIQESPQHSYTFELYDYNNRIKGALLKSVGVTGMRLDPPTIDSFTATPSSITRGDGSNLEWTTTGADTVTLTGHGTVEGDGNRTVVPWEVGDHRYTLTAKNKAGQVTDTVTVTVSLPPAPVIHSMSPSQGVPDSQTTIYGANFSTTEGSVSFGGSSAEINSCRATAVSVQVPG